VKLNKEEKTVLYEDLLADGGFGFRCKFTYSDTWCDVIAWEIKAIEDGKPQFWLEEHSSNSVTPLFEACPPYLTGFVKWDGCMELDQGCPHWCGPLGIKRHAALLQYIYRRVMALLPSNECPWDGTPEQMRVVTLP
jgi:hypothetical protein